MIREDFLHYLWQFKLFNSVELKGTNNEEIQLINSGTLNTNSGPDFFNGQVKINKQLWAGNIEIHIKSSDWYVHNHEKDSAYDNVILHVVWEDDMPVFREDNSKITTLVLQDYVADDLLKNYQKLVTKQQKWINCEKDIDTVDKFKLNNWLECLYIERLNQKSTQILTLLKQSKNDWEAVLFKLLTKNFGLKVNGNAFMNMANSFDFSLLRKSQSNNKKIEALLFGQAGMLTADIQEKYYQDLQKEYQFLQLKYHIKPIHNSQVKFFRLRPNNFPTIRISQLANLYVSHQNLFSKLINLKRIEDYYDLLQITTSEFWKTHYSFTSASTKRKKQLTKSFVDLLLINTIIPLKFVYQKHIDKLDDESILQLIQQLKPERNTIIDKFTNLKIKSSNAFETQALLQLKNEYCSKQKCLQCVIGNQLLKKMT